MLEARGNGGRRESEGGNSGNQKLFSTKDFVYETDFLIAPNQLGEIFTHFSFALQSFP